MTVFVINMARSTARLRRVAARLAELGVKWERLDAVDDSQLDEAARGRAFSRLGWWCCTLAPVVRGQLGCAMSHQRAQRAMVERGLDVACVLEDDVVLGDRFPEALAWAEKEVDASRAQVALFGDHARTPHKNDDALARFSLKRASWAWGAEGYALTRRAAEAMLADNSPIRVMNDTWGRWVDQGTIELFRVQPAVCAQTSWDNPDESEIARSMQAADLPPIGRAWWTVRRAIGVALDALSSPRRLRGRLVQLLRRMRIAGEDA